MKNLNHKIILILIMMSTPFYVRAGFEIKEIMYDLPGTDTGHEWIEVKNTGQSAEDFSMWRLVEAETAHTLTPIQGGANVGASAVVVVADNATQFLADHPGFSGQLFDSSFSLSNTGETLSLKDPSGNIADTVNYTNGSGAGDGNSLLRSGSSFTAHVPTPGIADDGDIQSQSNSTTQNAPAVGNTSVVSDTTNSSSISKNYQLRIGRDRSASVGLPVLFEATVEGIDNPPEIRWSFGDGGSGVGQVVNHIYRFPGNYIVTARIILGSVSSIARVRVSVREAGITLENFVAGGIGFTTVANHDTQEINLTGMKLIAGGYVFEFPGDTIISANEKVIFPNSVTGLQWASQETTISIVSAEGKVISEYKKPQAVFVPAVLGTSTESLVKKVAITPQKAISIPTSGSNLNNEKEQLSRPKETNTIVIGKKENHSFWYKIMIIPERVISSIFGLGS